MARRNPPDRQGSADRSGTPPSWTAEHFSQANPKGEGQDDVAALLRRVADTLDRFDDIEVDDLILHVDVTADGRRPSLTVYFGRVEDEGVDG